MKKMIKIPNSLFLQINKILSKDGKMIGFRLNKAQELIYDRIRGDLESKQYSWNIVIKGRQQGISTFGSILGLCLSILNDNFRSYSMAHIEKTIIDLFDNMVKFAYLNYPDKLKLLLPLKDDSARKLNLIKCSKLTTCNTTTNCCRVCFSNLYCIIIRSPINTCRNS